MSLSIILACLWVCAAAGAAALPSKKNHWPAAYVLMATGVPLLLFVGAQDGIWAAGFVGVAGASVLRWPLFYALRWIKARVVGRAI